MKPHVFYWSLSKLSVICSVKVTNKFYFNISIIDIPLCSLDLLEIEEQSFKCFETPVIGNLVLFLLFSLFNPIPLV